MARALPLVLIPGLACTPTLFQHQLTPLWAYGPLTIANHHQFSTMKETARFILETSPPEFELLGLSMGGYVALEIMRQAPLRVKKLALMSTSARADSAEQTAARRLQIAAARNDFKQTMKAAAPALFHREDAALYSTFIEMAEATGLDAFIREQETIISREDSRALLSSIQCPTLVLAAANDKLTPPPVMHEIADGIRGSRYVEIPACGHASPLEQPAFVTRTLVEWRAGL